MASPIAYQNLVTAAMLSSPDAWSSSAPLTNLAIRQLSEQAVRAAAGNTEIRVDLGVGRTIGYVAILAQNLKLASGAVTVRISGSLTSMTDDTFDYSESLSAQYLASIETPHYGVFTPVAISVRYLRIRITGSFSTPFRAGLVWVGPVLGQADGVSIDDPAIPPMGIDWVLYPSDPSQITKSRGAQAYPRGGTRVRSLRCGLYTLTGIQATGDIGSPWDVQRVGEYAGRELPMIATARTQHPTISALYTRHKHMVYGVQTLPWELRHKPGDFYEINLNFEGEN